MGVLDISALGDALGAPYEFNEYAFNGESPLTFERYKEHYGEWTDDTYMAIAIALGIINSGTVNGAIYQNIAQLFLRWKNEYPRGIGMQTEKILSQFDSESSYKDLIELSKINHIKNPGGSAGNGSLMRIHPVSLLNIDVSERVKLATNITKLTHYDQLCCDASVIWVELLAHARFTGELSPTLPLKYLNEDSRNYWSGIISEALQNESKVFSNRGWWVVPSLQQALSAVYHNMDALHSRPMVVFEEIIKAPGSDSDTICAISGGLMGALGVTINDFPDYLNIIETLNGRWPNSMYINDLYNIENKLLAIV